MCRQKGRGGGPVPRPGPPGQETWCSEILPHAGNKRKASQSGVKGANLSFQCFAPPQEVGRPWPAACLCKWSVTGTQPRTFLPGSSLAALLWQQQRRRVATETVRGPRSLKHGPARPAQGRFADSCPWALCSLQLVYWPRRTPAPPGTHAVFPLLLPLKHRWPRF